MAMATVDTREITFNGLPDFSFPPVYPNPSMEEIPSKPSAPSGPPNFGFPSYPIVPVRYPSPAPTQMPEIMTPLTPLDQSLQSQGPTLLTIPLEIRLHIYSYVLLSHPIDHANLAPNYNESPEKEELYTTINLFKPQGLSFPIPSSPVALLNTTTASCPKSHAISETNEVESKAVSSVRQTRGLKIQGKIPTGLLGSCHQIYSEARFLPFQTNSFTFVNWFWSGVYAARQFTRGLRPWQSDAMRFTGVEVLGRDLWVGGMKHLGGGIGGGTSSTGGVGGKEGKGVSEWKELCGLWRGVWGLRLLIKGSLVLEVGSQSVDGREGWNGENGMKDVGPTVESPGSQKSRERGLLNVELEWVVDGLLKMKSLRWIELEIEDEDFDRDAKLTFCGELERALDQLKGREGEWGGEVKVVFVEHIKAEPEKFKWYGGDPGDDEIWGLDTS